MMMNPAFIHDTVK